MINKRFIDLMAINADLRLEEPWIDLHGGSDLADWGRDEEIAWNQIHRQNNKYNFYIKAFDFLTDSEISGDYFEFGCHRVRTFRMALTEARRHNLSSMKFWAFDSFQGLPENVGDHGLGDKWAGGQLCTSRAEFDRIIEEFGVYVQNVKTVAGFYQQSLSPQLKVEMAASGVKASFICIDCDLYESAVVVLGFIDEFLQEGTIIYLDDYWVGYKGNPKKGIPAAFRNYCINSSWSFEPYLDVGYGGKSFICYKG